MFTFHDKFVQLESESERSWKFSILHAEKHRNQCHSAGLRLTQINVLVEFGDLWSVWFLTWQISFPDIPIKVHILSRNWTAAFIDKRWSGSDGTTESFLRKESKINLVFKTPWSMLDTYIYVNVFSIITLLFYYYTTTQYYY